MNHNSLLYFLLTLCLTVSIGQAQTITSKQKNLNLLFKKMALNIQTTPSLPGRYIVSCVVLSDIRNPGKARNQKLNR